MELRVDSWYDGDANNTFHVRLLDTDTDETILELSGDEVSNLIDDETLDLDDLEDTFIDYAIEQGLIEEIDDDSDEENEKEAEK